MVEVLNEVETQANMLEWHRDDAVAELLRLKQPEPQIRHRESITSYVDVRLLPREGVVWSGGITPEQLVVEKRCFGGRYELIQHEKAVLECLRTDRIGHAVFGMVGQFEYSDSTHDEPLIGVRLQYGGLDLSKWNQICYSNDSRFDPFCQAPFLLQLASRVLRCLVAFHGNGYIHCDLKLDNICARTRRVSRQGDYLVGAIDLQTLKLIDFGLSICRRRLDNGMLAVISAPPKWAARRRNSNGVDAESLLISAEGTWANYLSDEYIDAFGQQDRASRIDGRVDLYSLASWLRQLCYVYDAESSGIGPWPSARLRKELVGTAKERELLQALPNMIHDAYRMFNPDDLPHVDIMSRIDKVVGHKPWEWPFEVPFAVTGPQLLQRRERAACTLMTTLHQDVLVDLPAPAELRLLVEHVRRDEHRAESPMPPLPAGEATDPEADALVRAPETGTPETLYVPLRTAVVSERIELDGPDNADVPSDGFSVDVEDVPQAKLITSNDALGIGYNASCKPVMEGAESSQVQEPDSHHPVLSPSPALDQQLPETEPETRIAGAHRQVPIKRTSWRPFWLILTVICAFASILVFSGEMRREVPALDADNEEASRVDVPPTQPSSPSEMLQYTLPPALPEADVESFDAMTSALSAKGRPWWIERSREANADEMAWLRSMKVLANEGVPHAMLWQGVLRCYGMEEGGRGVPLDVARAQDCGTDIANTLRLAREQSESGRTPGKSWNHALTNQSTGALLPLLWRELDQSSRTASTPAAVNTFAHKIAPALELWPGESAPLDYASAVMYACLVDRRQYPGWRKNVAEQLKAMSKRYANLKFGQMAAAASRDPDVLCKL